MSTRFGTCVGYSAKSIVLETRLESSNIAWHVNSLPNCHFSVLLGKEPVLRGKTTNDDDKRVARRIMSYI